MRVTHACQEAEARVQMLQKSLKRVIVKSKPYFELKAQFNHILEVMQTYNMFCVLFLQVTIIMSPLLSCCVVNVLLCWQKGLFYILYVMDLVEVTGRLWHKINVEIDDESFCALCVTPGE